MTITLESIKAEQTKLSQMISSFEAQKAFEEVFPINVAMPSLLAGEEWVCAVIAKDGKTKYHLTLLPGDQDGADWDSQMAWAKGQGGDLPDRVEQALLYKYMHEQFKEAAYWSNTPSKTNDGCAWFQGFYHGYQLSYGRKGLALRGRAVRRLVIE